MSFWGSISHFFWKLYGHEERVQNTSLKVMFCHLLISKLEVIRHVFPQLAMCLNDCLIHVGKIPQTWVAVGFGSQAFTSHGTTGWVSSVPGVFEQFEAFPQRFSRHGGAPQSSLHFQILPGGASKDSDLRFSSWKCDFTNKNDGHFELSHYFPLSHTAWWFQTYFS